LIALVSKSFDFSLQRGVGTQSAVGDLRDLFGVAPLAFELQHLVALVHGHLERQTAFGSQRAQRQLAPRHTTDQLIGAGAVLGAQVCLTGSTPIIDVTGSEPVIHKGRVPPRSVLVPGSRKREFPAGEFQVTCALIIGRRSESTDLRTSLNDALREFELGA